MLSDCHPTINKKSKKPITLLKQKLNQLLIANGIEEPLPADVPSKWEKHGDLVLLPSTSFSHKIWQNIGSQVWDAVAEVLKCQRVGRKYSIINDDYRTPHVELLRGKSGWVTHIDNGIKYTFDVTKCMFSAGNIIEKIRIAKFNCKGETVVDLYAGIGYFTLPYLVHADASEVHACEWNPDAVEALEKNLVLNGVREKCTIHFGDNRQVCPKGIADRINLGLIPSSQPGWQTACEALKPESGGILHVHGTVTSGLQLKYSGGCGMTEPQTELNATDCTKLSDKVRHRSLGLTATTKEMSSTSEAMHLKNGTNEKQQKIKLEWREWTKYVCLSVKNILSDLYKNEWEIIILNIERIKPYAPHIDHIVADIKCQPCKC